MPDPFAMFKNFWQRKPKSLPAVQYPLGLSKGQVEALRQWRSEAGYEAFQHVVAELARKRLARVLSVESNKVEFERGALASLNELHDVVDTLLAKSEEIDDRTRSNGSKRISDNAAAAHWGNQLWWYPTTQR